MFEVKQIPKLAPLWFVTQMGMMVDLRHASIFETNEESDGLFEVRFYCEQRQDYLIIGAFDTLSEAKDYLVKIYEHMRSYE